MVKAHSIKIRKIKFEKQNSKFVSSGEIVATVLKLYRNLPYNFRQANHAPNCTTNSVMTFYNTPACSHSQSHKLVSLQDQVHCMQIPTTYLHFVVTFWLKSNEIGVNQ